MAADELPKSDPALKAPTAAASAAPQGSSNKGMSAMKGWIAAMKPPPSATAAHRKYSTDDGSASSDQQRWSSSGGGGGGKGAADGSLWSPDVAAAMGYGKRGRAGSAFQWWILVLSALLALGSYIAWCVLVMRARDATEAALTALKVNFVWWDTLRAILLATAITFPILVLLAVGVSAWRAVLAGRLNIHAPDDAWRASSRAFQVANVVSSVLLYLLMLLLVASLGAHYTWAFSARAGHIGSYYALTYVEPIWNGTSSVVKASQSLVNNFVGLTQNLGRRRMQEVDGIEGQDFLVIGGRRLTAADFQSMPPEVLEAGLAAARSLQQLPGIFNNLGGLLSGAASAINSVPMPRVDTARIGNLPFLPQLLPNGTSNPLFNTLRGVTDAVQAQLINPSGCPIYCVDLRNNTWIQDGCVCNLDRVKAAYPHIAEIYSQAIPTIIMLFLMTIASTWLLLHAASQWARTRSEAKLLDRIPHAAKHALAAQQHAATLQQHKQQQNGVGGGGSTGACAKGLQEGGQLKGCGSSTDGVVNIDGPAVYNGLHGSSGQQLQQRVSGGGSRGLPVSTTGEPSAPLEGLPAKQQPAPQTSV